jgi:hypothetical protein
MRDPHLPPVAQKQAVERQASWPTLGTVFGPVLRLRRLVWKEDTPLHSQFRLAWAVYFALVGLVVLLHVVTVR